ncbi:hypothetical protein EJB05_10161, partial [Eragrostis curvula]
MQHDSIVGDPSPPRQMAGHRHKHLKSVKITECSSLECFTLDTTFGLPRCSEHKFGTCFPMKMGMLRESQKALLAVGEHIERRVPLQLN